MLKCAEEALYKTASRGGCILIKPRNFRMRRVDDLKGGRQTVLVLELRECKSVHLKFAYHIIFIRIVGVRAAREDLRTHDLTQLIMEVYFIRKLWGRSQDLRKANSSLDTS